MTKHLRKSWARIVWGLDQANHFARLEWRALCDLNDRLITGERFRTGVGSRHPATITDEERRGLRVRTWRVADNRCCIHNRTWHADPIEGKCTAPGCTCPGWVAS